MSLRKQISKRVRFDIFKRDGFVCQYCGAHPPAVLLHIDHIEPVALGGGNEPDNLITACQNCNLGKSDVPLSVVPQSLAERAAEVAEREAQIAGFTAIMQAAKDRLEADAWAVVEALTGRPSDIFSRSKFTSVQKFVQQLGRVDVVRAAEIATMKRGYGTAGSFKYFCGICWRWVKEGVQE